MDYQAFTFELPERMDDAPEPSTEKVRHIKLPDGKHWVKVRGGSTQREALFLSHITNYLSAKHETDDERQAALRLYNQGLATFIADRVVDHNLTYPDGDEKLPLGMALFYELSAQDALALIRTIQSPPSFFVDPKVARTSTGG